MYNNFFVKTNIKKQINIINKEFYPFKKSMFFTYKKIKLNLPKHIYLNIFIKSRIRPLYDIFFQILFKPRKKNKLKLYIKMKKI